MPSRSVPTIVYIDGFNFYYGLVKGTPFKWLDLQFLFHTILSSHNNLIKIKYFTARVQPSPTDTDVNIRQDAYLRALSAHCPKVELHFGHFLRHKIFMENANPPPSSVEVWKNEEKGSDVNLALHLLNDAWSSAYDCAVIASNDSDLAESLRMVKEQHGKIIGLITPGAPKRKTSYQLRRYADFLKPVRRWTLQLCQPPDSIPGTTIRKPSSW